MLGLLQPLVFQQVLELWVEILVVLHAFDVVPESHPLDVQDRNRDSQGTVRKHEPLHILCGTDKVALVAEACFEFLAEALEKVNVLRLLAGKLEQSTDLVVVSRELRPRVVNHVGKNEFLDEAKHGQIFMAADLIQSPLLGLCEKGKLLGLRQRRRHERLSEIEPFLASNNVFHSPADPLGGFERPLVTVITLHCQSSFVFCSSLPLANEQGQKMCQGRHGEIYVEKTES